MSTQTEMKITALAPWFGSKRTLAPRIIAELGKHSAYWEPFCGSLTLVTVIIDGQTYIITDIGMRMLSPRELFLCQGFPDSYIIDPIVKGKPLTKSAQVRMCGNSVCPQVAAALVRANFSVAKSPTQEVA